MEIDPYKKKKIKFFLSCLFLIISAFILTVFIYLKVSEPKLDGSETLSGLINKIEISRDSSGIPHIFGQNDIDTYRALGYLMASERLFQMEISRRLASGELAEILGEKGLKSDKMFRTLRLRSMMKEMLDYKKSHHLLNQKMMEEMEAFYAGVNQYQASHPLPIEFKILGIKPRPFEVLDGYCFIGLMSFSFAIATMQEPLFSTLESRIGPELVDDLRIEKINSFKKSVISSKKSHFNHSHVLEIISYLENGFSLFEGSNGWLLSKTRTSNGENMLVNDPHISFPHPGIWFEASLHTPDLELYGHFLPLIPFPVLAHNRFHAHGLTMSLIDDMDLYREKIIGNEYLFKGIKYPLKHLHQKIKIKGQNDFDLDIKISQHGPILDEFIADKNIALKWTFYDQNNDPISVFYKMNRAQNMEEFKSAVKEGIAPGLNILYADHENIAWWIFGKIMIKPEHVRSDFILDGASGKDEYIREMNFSEKPHSENPPSGVIVSANSRPVDFPPNQRGDWQPNDRFNTISNIISKKEKWSEGETKELQTLSLNLENKIILDQLLIDLKAINADNDIINILKGWDLVSDKNSIAPTIFYSFLNQLAKDLLANELSPEELEIYGKLPASHLFKKRLILESHCNWWKKYDRKKSFEISYQKMVTSLQTRFGKNHSDWTWGKLHTIEFTHPLGKVWPLNYIFNLGPYPLSGATQDINNQKSTEFKDRFNVLAGPSTRRIISFAHLDESLGGLPVGESGHLLSPYYKNQLANYLNGIYRPMWLSSDKIKSNEAHHLILNP